MLQWEGKLPICVNVKENEFPTATFPLSNTAVLDVIVCVVMSLLVQVTVVPALTCRLDGWKVRPLIETAAVLCVAVGVGVDVGVCVAGVDDPVGVLVGVPVGVPVDVPVGVDVGVPVAATVAVGVTPAGLK